MKVGEGVYTNKTLRQILADFAALKVPLRAEQFDAVPAEAVRDGLSHQQFLHRLIAVPYA